ncbi:MAG TPA: hypothetical protein VMM85_04765, partial [Methylomirabilota bacterium]|nr:hypothetical protein [Methylomirabilota bacterium]
VVGAAGLGRRVADEEGDSSLEFDYDHNHHELTLVYVEVDGGRTEVADGACAVSTREIGMLNPHTSVIEVSLHCGEVDVPGLGPVPIVGSLIVDLSLLGPPS